MFLIIGIGVLRGKLVRSDPECNQKKKYPRKAELPFDSNMKMMATLHEINGEQIVYIKGAPEPLLKLCGSIDTNTGYPVASVSEAMISESLTK